MTRIDRTPLATAFLPRLKQALKATPVSTLLDCLGYRGSSRSRAHQRIDELQAATDLFTWLRRPGFDFRYTQEEFFLALARCLPDIDTAQAEAVVEEVRQEQARRDSLYSAWIQVDTGPVRLSRPLFAMAAMGTARFIKIDRGEIRDDFCEELERVRRIVRAHYRHFEGVIIYWGKIRKYDWHFGEGQVLCLSPEGEVLTSEAPDTQMAQATLSVR